MQILYCHRPHDVFPPSFYTFPFLESFKFFFFFFFGCLQVASFMITYDDVRIEQNDYQEINIYYFKFNKLF